MKKSNFSVSCVFAGVVFLLRHAVAKPLPENSPQYHRKDDHGAVASEVGVCSNIGLDLLKQGGNAADAVSCWCSVFNWIWKLSKRCRWLVLWRVLVLWVSREIF